jgi:IclR family transcriptional regulator, KDG regulon repressor
LKGEADQVSARTKPRAAAVKSPARIRVAAVRDIDRDAEERQRGGGVQSIARALAIMEEIARNRDGIGLAELSKRVGLHNSTTFHLVKTMVSLGYVRQLKDSQSATASAARCSRSPPARSTSSK